MELNQDPPGIQSHCLPTTITSTARSKEPFGLSIKILTPQDAPGPSPATASSLHFLSYASCCFKESVNRVFPSTETDRHPQQRGPFTLCLYRKKTLEVHLSQERARVPFVILPRLSHLNQETFGSHFSIVFLITDPLTCLCCADDFVRQCFLMLPLDGVYET